MECDKLIYSNLVVLCLRAIQPWIQRHQQEASRGVSTHSESRNKHIWKVWSPRHICLIVESSAA